MLYVVHCVDTEGPLRETLEATFERLQAIFGLDLEPTPETLRKLQERHLDVGSAELAERIAKTIDPRNLGYLDSWDRIAAMLDRLDSPEVRLALPDSEGGGWRVNWHCLAHHGFDPARNPRGRELGVHSVFDWYRARYGDRRLGDAIHWHFHPIPRTRQANHSATHHLTDPAIFEIISRRILERHWFPCVSRPGFHAERPDSHWFLEQWMPFDMANNNTDQEIHEADLAHGRFGDWRHAPKDWVVHHPHHDDYQRPGNCRRAIARCLYLGGRFNCLTQAEVEAAFRMAREGPTVMAFTNHDYRDIVPDVREAQAMIASAAARFPDVSWRHADAAEAMRAALGLGDGPPIQVGLNVEALANGTHRVDIGLDSPPFGPQPWFCYALRDGGVWHDNLDGNGATNRWSYILDEQTARLGEIARIGIGVNAPNGRTTVTTLDTVTGRRRTEHHN